MRLAWFICLTFCASFAFGVGLTDSVVCDGPVAGDFVGGHDMRRPARAIGEGETASFELRVSPTEPLTLEIEELDGRLREVRGYHVFVDDRPAYFRTWQTSGAGPLHYFVQLPPPGRDRITVKFVNRSPTPFAISRIWAFADFEKHFDAGGFVVPYYLAPTVPRQNDLAGMRASLQTIKTAIGARPNIKAAWTTWIPYAARTERQCADRIDEALALAEEFDMPVQICFDSWWANTPSGPDGKGGRWTDVEYQQVVWNETTRTMELSIPNRWSSVPWLSTNHPDLNAFKSRRIAAAAAHLRARFRELQLRGKQHLVLAINLDNEPVYWANGSAALGDELKWADFNPHAVAAAKNEGVALDPRDGLSRQERLWLWKNLARYNELIAASVAGALGKDACFIANDRCVAPVDLLADNIYTQAMMMSDPERQFPMLDRAYPLWETAAPKSCRVGGEWNADAPPERQGVEHQLALGRNAAINAECEDDERQHLGVGPGYALGQRYYTPYNYPLDKLHVAAADVDDLNKPFPPLIAQRPLIEFRFDSDDWKSQVVSHDNVATKLIGNTTAVAATLASIKKTAQLTYRIDLGKSPSRGLGVDLSCRANDYRGLDPAVQIRVLAGETADAATMREIIVINQSPDLNAIHHIDLSAASGERKELFVRFELLAPTIPQELATWCAIHRIVFTTPWPAELTQSLPAQDLSMRRSRKQSQLISWRRDAELAIERAADKTAAQAAYDEGRYADAYRIAVSAAAIQLPATFIVKDTGPLASYPIRVETKQPAAIVLKECTPQQIRLGTVNAGDATVKVVLQSRHIAAKDGEDWILHPSDAAGAATTFDLTFSARPAATRSTRPARRTETIQGVVKVFRPTSPYEMPAVAIDDRPPRVIDLSAPLHRGEETRTLRTRPVGSAELKPGQGVRMTVDADTGRVLELWEQ